MFRQRAVIQLSFTNNVRAFQINGKIFFVIIFKPMILLSFNI